MTRDEIASVTYEVAERLNQIKHDRGLVDDPTYRGVGRRLQVARELLTVAGRAQHSDRASLELANRGTMFGPDEMKWPMGRRFRISPALIRTLITGLAEEIVHTAARFIGRHDIHICERSLGNRVIG
jgi:hypothetical protein